MKFNTKIFYLVVLSIMVSFFAGGGWALYSLRNIDDQTGFMQYNGPWRVNPSMDLKNHFQRALIAKVGLFALRETEVIYYTAMKDSNGEPLNSKYNYILEGTVPDARYWSFALYGKDNFLIPNKDKKYTYNQNSIEYSPKDTSNPELASNGQETYQIVISRNKDGLNWLPSGSDDQITITLRLYNPSPAVYKNLETIPLPTIRKVQ